MKQAICPECNKPAGEYKPGAKIYHFSCLYRKFRPYREEQKAIDAARKERNN